MIFLAATSLCFGLFIIWQSYSQIKEREAFGQERQQWVRERQDLNNRIQVPEAAPFLLDDDPEAAEDDLPTLPEFAVDEAQLDQARKALEEVGYEESGTGM